ncbi:MAG: VacJ family lipoprotein [Proteobacteria bacterium]|nr:VacJ family lipoprotein [Pseudomonadota bacterium]
MKLKKLTVTVLSASIFISGCGAKGKNPQDPYEPINRRIYAFNTAIDTAIYQPVATFYNFALPWPVREMVSNFYSNIDMLPTVANDFLQFEWQYAGKDIWRFLINSTLGIGGLFDVAKHMGMPKHHLDLGLTFARWSGTNYSPYIVIPFLGPSTIRDTFGYTYDYFLFTPYPYIQPYYIQYALYAGNFVQKRASLMENEKAIEAAALDRYVFERDAYLQYRNAQMEWNKNGSDKDNYVEAANVKTKDSKPKSTGKSDDKDPYVE